jgi:spore coat polysaccharide biosynthesis predicted glycosyltransferase SpsG
MVTVVADAAPAVGLGHLSRSSALAAALRELGVATRCLAFDAPAAFARDGVEWTPWTPAQLTGVVVLDSYLLRPGDVAAGATVAVFHDGGARPEGVALLIAPIAGGDLTGLEYACLRREFWLPPERVVRERVEHVLVTTGGGPTGAELAATLAQAALNGLPEATVTMLRGPAARLDAPAGARVLGPQPSLRRLLLEADVVLSAAGQTALEAAASGTPAVLVALDALQAEQGARLAAAGAARLVEPGQVADTLERLDSAERAAMAAAGPAVVDGRGAHRVAAAVAALRPPRGAAT